MIRERLSGDLKEAIKAQDPTRISTLRLICAAIKDRDLNTRSDEGSGGMPESEILGILAQMIRQRETSADAYDEAGQVDMAEKERAEIEIIRSYLPRQLSDKEVRSAIATAIHDTGAASIRDMGKVMAHLKAHHTGRMDFARACACLKNSFG
ncbi:MAG TPA: GatB/YqeY domain-containing protein [Amaricoccus sp.]|uniref:GatB/YqeY domain-containing protein n=1 Tax=Amaricoccus sp. TaxID=1872485 RepID=UPI001DC77885|nr:GatB/YqeY domain-containing protein [Amaricoccus sp.]MCB1373669.1 GatB/YqeY domain-containing protein [Paracoccaceae bacterium]MCC0066040.1 GatB/YqeY domain-containing protein [Rhodovulum sp.]MCB1404471.1 GatB/YqeY domain-containing protein [Paracoccaceae bacterium]HPG22748.1 GatB/YqeY domain-containing protein [Amaricoccus sp.]HRW16715.1 GatB/YqeY domain-containing protein [Amaricoccus sp.]